MSAVEKGSFASLHFTHLLEHIPRGLVQPSPNIAAAHLNAFIVLVGNYWKRHAKPPVHDGYVTVQTVNIDMVSVELRSASVKIEPGGGEESGSVRCKLEIIKKMLY